MREDTGLGTLKEFSERFGQENVHFVKCDVTKDEEIVNLYESCEAHFNKKVDIFCNNAGINHLLGWRKCMQIDIVSSSLLSFFLDNGMMLFFRWL